SLIPIHQRGTEESRRPDLLSDAPSEIRVRSPPSISLQRLVKRNRDGECLAPYCTQRSEARFVIFGVMNTRISVRVSFSVRLLKNHPNSGMSPRNGTLLYAKPVLRV